MRPLRKYREEPKAAGRKRPVVLVVRMTHEERELLHELAHALGIGTAAGVVRWLAVRERERRAARKAG